MSSNRFIVSTIYFEDLIGIIKEIKSWYRNEVLKLKWNCLSFKMNKKNSKFVIVMCMIHFYEEPILNISAK